MNISPHMSIISQRKKNEPGHELGSKQTKPTTTVHDSCFNSRRIQTTSPETQTNISTGVLTDSVVDGDGVDDGLSHITEKKQSRLRVSMWRTKTVKNPVRLDREKKSSA